jgi:hypothetical protein
MNNEQSPLDELPILRKKLLSEIEVALKQGGKSNFYEATERLRSGDSLLEQVASLWRGQQSPLASKTTTEESDGNFPADYISAKARGERVRSNWVNSNLGRAVVNVKGALYRNGRGEILGIAYAKEAENRKDRWFSGLPEKKYQIAVLLCESINGKLVAVCLPQDFLARYKQKFSKANGQDKFNVIKRGGEWFLSVPATGEVAITENINKFTLIA